MRILEEIGIIIPAYNPDNQLVNLVENLIEKGYRTIIVVNDGSNKISQKYFKKIEGKCYILNNKVNQGKGNALKKGFRYILKNYEEKKGIITVDADGQHSIEDIRKSSRCISKRHKQNDIRKKRF